jgi:hypothetical protein
MPIHAMNWPLVRCVAYLRRIAAALDRLAPPPRPAPRHAEFSVATRDDFERGYDTRGVPEEPR